MTKVRINNLSNNQYIEVDRLIGKIEGSHPGPVHIFFAGIHGNEPAGIFALDQVLDELAGQRAFIHGCIYAISGNLAALKQGERYLKEDLNRIWTTERLLSLQEQESHLDNEEEIEQREIYLLIQEILSIHNGPFYFTDLHTTSSRSIPFITLNDTLLNRKFTINYPMPLILGIEEYLRGPLLSYINELGYLAFGFEGGQHDDETSIKNHIAFIYVTLALTACFKKAALYTFYLNQLASATVGITGFYEIFHRHKVLPSDNFTMVPGYANFQIVKKGTHLANNNQKQLKSKQDARILMPLYQAQGNDGFFLISRILPFYLNLSILMRKVKIDSLLVFLPGISWRDGKKKELIVDLSIARFFTKQFFHLMGYRTINISKVYMMVHSREAASRDEEYINAVWY